MGIHGEVFYEVASILFIAAVFGAIGYKLKQPLIVAFIATGIFVGPSGIGLIEEYDKIALLAQIGIALLLFVVGLRLDLHLIMTTGPVALATGLGQVIFTSVFGFIIAIALGLSLVPAIYVAVALTFSSTIIIVKLLSDKKEIDSLHGRIAVGFLIVQDIVVVIAMIALTAIGSVGDETAALKEIVKIFGMGILLIAVIAFLMKFVLPYLLKHLARSTELLVVFAIAWAVGLGALSDWMGFSKEVGAFLGGISVASTQYRDAIGARLVTLRDFLLLFFFIDLGARLDLSMLGAQVLPAMIFSLFVLIGNPSIVLSIMGLMGYRRRTGFLAGLTVAQISEFSLILAALGLSLNHIEDETMGLITLVGLITICASTYMILYSGPLYNRLSNILRIFEKKNPYRESAQGDSFGIPDVDAILIGLGNYGGGIASDLMARKWNLVGVDFDPNALARWRERGLPVIFGDAADPEILEQLPIDRARWVICTNRDRQLNMILLTALKNRKYTGKIAMAAANQEDAQSLQEAGAHVVLRPFSDAAEQAADELNEARDALTGVADWPVAMREVRLKAGSVFSGRTIREVPVRSEAGASIIAVSRAGVVNFDPGPDFRIYPGDRLILLGEPGKLQSAVDLLEKREFGHDVAGADSLNMAEIKVDAESSIVGKSLADVHFRGEFGVTVIGIRRGENRIVSPGGGEILQGGDSLIVVGKNDAIERITNEAPL